MRNISKEQDSNNTEIYKNLIKMLLKKWPIFSLSLIIALAVGTYLNKSTAPTYRNSAIMLITDNSEGRVRYTNEMMRMRHELSNISSSIEDELGIISSFPLVYETTKQLNVKVSYFIKDKLIIKDIYKNSPFTLLYEKDSSLPIDILFELKILSKNNYQLRCISKDKVGLYNYESEEVTSVISEINIDKNYDFGENVNHPKFDFTVILNSNFVQGNYVGKTFYFRFNNIERLTYQYKASLNIERQSLSSSLVDITFSNANPNFVTDFINTLTKVFLDQNLNKKNSIADKTIKFIDQQISEVADTLGITANQLKEFRTKHNVMDINFLSRTVYQQMTELENQRAVLFVESKYYDYIKEYFESNRDLTDLLAPSAMGVEDPQLSNLINQLTSVNAERALILDNKSYNHPNLPNLNAKVNNLKKTILENIDYIVNTSNITINDIDRRILTLQGQVNNLPAIEKELINIEREFHINDAIYTLLLETRAEAEIAKASNSPDYEIIEPSKYSGAKKVSPKSKMNYIICIFLGLLIPLGIIVLMSTLDEKINEKKEVDRMTKFPIIGSIAKNDKKSVIPVIEAPKSSIAESFRSVRTSLRFFQKGEPKQKIMITSSVSGEGKTFLSLNLASAFSYFGKKTLLLEFDLRNPQIAENLHLNNDVGLSSYLVNDAKLEDIIIHSEYKNLDIIPAGQIPPNPVELIASQNTKNLIEILQSIYEYIIIDTPPIGVVTDPFLLIDYTDLNIFTVRLKHTNKKQVDAIFRDFEQKEISNIGIVLNDDEGISNSVYYDDEGRNLSFIKKKINTFKSLVKLKK